MVLRLPLKHAGHSLLWELREFHMTEYHVPNASGSLVDLVRVLGFGGCLLEFRCQSQREA